MIFDKIGSSYAEEAMRKQPVYLISTLNSHRAVKGALYLYLWIWTEMECLCSMNDNNEILKCPWKKITQEFQVENSCEASNVKKIQYERSRSQMKICRHKRNMISLIHMRPKSKLLWNWVWHIDVYNCSDPTFIIILIGIF